MQEKARKWLAEQYDQRGHIARYNRKRHPEHYIRIHNCGVRECRELKNVLEGAGLHTSIDKDSRQEESYYLRMHRRKDVLEFCVSIYPYLKEELKRNNMVAAWREAGWCICEDVREPEKDVVR